MMQKNETGRSMVEMLGVLAVIGVLSVGGIQGYQYAMNRYRANEILTFLDTAMISVDGSARTAPKNKWGQTGDFIVDVDGEKVEYYNFQLDIFRTFQINKDICRILAKELDLTKWDYLPHDMFGCGGNIFIMIAGGFSSYMYNWGMWGTLNCQGEDGIASGSNVPESTRLNDCENLTGDTIQFYVGA